MSDTNQMSEGKHTPECDCGSKLCNGSMRLNGLRFVCESQCSLTDHSSRWPVYEAAPVLLEALKDLADSAKLVSDYVSKTEDIQGAEISVSLIMDELAPYIKKARAAIAMSKIAQP